METQKQIDKLWRKAKRLESQILRYGAFISFYERKQQQAQAEFDATESLAYTLELEKELRGG